MTHSLNVPEIAARYASGESAQAIARALEVDVSAINRRLRNAGVALRGAAGATAANLARDPRIRQRMGRPRMWPVNESFFDLLTPNVAYVIGLWQADGSNQVRRGAICITLRASDAGHLTAVAEEMGASRPLAADANGGRRLYICNQKLSEGLARWGIVSPKTFTASTDPRLQMNPDYWRGVVDGDGTLCVTADGRRILALVGSEQICHQFLWFCRAHGCGKRANVHPNRSIWTAKVSDSQALRMALVMYDRPGLALPRKAATAYQWRADNA